MSAPIALQIQGYREPHVGVDLGGEHLHLSPRAALALAQLVEEMEPDEAGRVPITFTDSWHGRAVTLTIDRVQALEVARLLRSSAEWAEEKPGPYR